MRSIGAALPLFLTACVGGVPADLTTVRPANPPLAAPVACGEYRTPESRSTRAYDLIIEGGTVVDGSGAPGFLADIAVREGRIDCIGPLAGAAARRRIDARGKHVSPGFIDAHLHALAHLEEHPTADNLLLQGITTAIDGHDGVSLLPLAAAIDSIDALRPSFNLAFLAGHGALRRQVMGRAIRPPTSTEIERMKALLAAELRAGALGLSVGRGSVPGSHAHREELLELARVAARMERLYVVNPRNDARGLLEVVREAIEVAEASGASLHLSPLRVVERTRSDVIGPVLLLLAAARNRGLLVSYDLDLHEASSGSLRQILPLWALQDDRLAERFARQGERARMLEAVAARLEDITGGELDRVQLASCRGVEGLNGSTLAELVGAEGRESRTVAGARKVIELELLGGCTVLFHTTDATELERLLARPEAMLASEGAVLPAGSAAHPRAFGTYPRAVARSLREPRWLSLECAIRKMTAIPASRFGLRLRGELREGWAADIVVFDPARIADRGGYLELPSPPTGIDYVLVGGTVVVDRGRHTGERPGRTLMAGAGPIPPNSSSLPQACS